MGYKRNPSYLKVFTTKGIFKCRLLIDCSGVTSSIFAKTFPEVSPIYCSVYGQEIKINTDSPSPDIVLMGASFNSSPQIYYEIFPTRSNNFIFYVFAFSEDYKSPNKLKRSFRKHLNLYKRETGVTVKRKTKTVKGVIPSESFSKNAADKVFFFGDSSLIPSPLSVFGMASILKSYKEYAGHLSDCLDSNLLDKKSLSIRFFTD